ncbi:MAG: sugar transferase [Sphingobacteriales bacterium]|nr:MAG: sugar transferase [Sphingobacteriales bacterium]
MNKPKESAKYIIADFLSAALVWTLFYLYRHAVIEPEKYGYEIPVFNFDANYFLAIFLIPACWVVLFWLFGSYKNIYKKSRVKELAQTFTLSFLGCMVLFFTILIDDVVGSYSAFRSSFFVLLSLQFFVTYGFRFILLTQLKYKLKNRLIGFNTLLVGGNQKSLNLYNELENERFSQGYKFSGFVTIDEEKDVPLARKLPQLGNYAQLPQIIERNKIEEVILAIESSEHGKLAGILTLLEDCKTVVKVIPDMYDIITGSVKMNYVFGTALIEINQEIMPAWQKNVKRLIDIFASLLILIIGSPFYLIVALYVKLSSPGPVFYKQERIGIHSKPFNMIKFRTMYVDAEKLGPQLSSDNDPRITPLGLILRKYRIDEFPQFYNVLVGDMSLVGPRPERQFFINQIVLVAPHYRHLLKVKPGITSWGMIKFGYASNVDEMVERMKFDILYVENMSLAMDLKILFYTIVIMLQGRGK